MDSTSSSLSRNWRFDVFPSFCGEDLRKTFLSYFLKELQRKGILLNKSLYQIVCIFNHITNSYQLQLSSRLLWSTK